MKERPIIFNAEMVKAILEGRKTQTRRLLKPQPEKLPSDVYCDAYRACGYPKYSDIELNKYFTFWTKNNLMCISPRGNWKNKGKETCHWVCPYGQVGDRLWVRETIRVDLDDIYYKADGKTVNYQEGEQKDFIDNYGRKTEDITIPSIHMPRWASRITLEIIEVRVERLQEITAKDCVDEGCGRTLGTNPHYHPRDRFKDYWNSIFWEGILDWDSNPWVWVIGFRRV